MGIGKFFFKKNGNDDAMSDGVWDASLEVIPEGEKIRYRIYERYAELKPGDSFDLTTVFGENGVSTDEYVEFLYVIGKLIDRYPMFYTDEELDEALAKVSSGESEDAELMFKIGNSYMGREAFVEAAKWHKRAAELGHSEAMSLLGGQYRHGNGVEQDIRKAMYWYKQSIVTDGNDNALLDLGLCYLQGEGVPVDYDHGFFLMQRSARQNNMLAQFNMGGLYRKGRGVEPDMEEALRWYRRSAAQGYEKAVEAVGEAEDRS